MEQVLKEKLELLTGFDDEITQLCKIDDIELEIELADEIWSKILEMKGNIAKACASLQVHDGPLSTSSHTTGQVSMFIIHLQLLPTNRLIKVEDRLQQPLQNRIIIWKMNQHRVFPLNRKFKMADRLHMWQDEICI